MQENQSHTAFGAVWKRRRKEAIAIQFHNHDFCKRMGWSALTRFFDVANAFYCVRHEEVLQRFESCDEPYRLFFQQVTENCLTAVECQDGLAVAAPSSGVPPGLTCATKLFNACYDVPLQQYYKSIRHATKLLDVVGLEGNEIINSSSTSFVDDLATTVVGERSPHELGEYVQRINTQRNHAIQTHGLKQNTTKAQSIACCRGVGSRNALRQLAQNREVGIAKQARYLGPHLHWAGSTAGEIEQRITSSWGSFHMCKRFWKSDTRISFKRNVFVAAVVSTLVSGLICFCH